MPLNRPLALSTGLAAGVIAAVGCYAAASGAGASPHPTPRSPAVPAAAVVAPQPSVSFAPCQPPAELEHGVCVTRVVVTKVVPATAGSAAPLPGSRSAGASEHQQSAGHEPATRSGAGEGEDSDETTEPADSAEAEHESEVTDEHESEGASEHEDQDHEDQDHEDQGSEDPDEP